MTTLPKYDRMEDGTPVSPIKYLVEVGVCEAQEYESATTPKHYTLIRRVISIDLREFSTEEDAEKFMKIVAKMVGVG